MDLNSYSISIPPGKYALGISGGADSTALAILTTRLPDVSIILVHLNHQLRGQESDDDEQFVRKLAIQLNLPLVVGQRFMLEETLNDLPKNPSAKYRAMRIALFKKTIEMHDLDGLLLAHHADDQAETILLRLVRGSGIHSLIGMPVESRINGLRVVRPMLGMRNSVIREYLLSIDQNWREDSSNQSEKYRRNIIRTILKNQPVLFEHLLKLSQTAKHIVEQLDAVAPILNDIFLCKELEQLPTIVARHAARRWLSGHGSPVDDISPATCDRLVDQAINPESSLRQHYPGKIWVRRRKKQIDVIPPKKA